MNIASNITDLIGNTPMVKLNHLNTGNAEIALKLEYYNPANSIKDRPALQMILDGEKDGKIDKDTIIIEPTSGNMGIGLAMICAVRGYKIIITMPESMSLERRMLMKAYGAELVLTPASEGMLGAVKKAYELHEKYPNSFIPSQFNNPSNPKSHYENTAEEIWHATEGKVDIIVAGVGTGGTISGISKKLKEKNPNIKAIAVEPDCAKILSKNQTGPHKIQGIGPNFVPQNFDKNLVDEIISVTNENSEETAKFLGTKEGILAGFSGGANVWAAIEISKRPQNSGKLIVTIIPDFGERYLSCGLYQ